MDVGEHSQKSTGLTARFALVAFSMVAGVSYRVVVGALTASIVQFIVLVGLALLFLLLALIARSEERWRRFWEIPFAFFVFTVAGIAGDGMGFIQHLLFLNVLHETPSITGQVGIAQTVWGTVLAQFLGMLCQVVAIILLTKASGSDLKSIFIDRTTVRRLLLVGVAGFVLFYALAAVPIAFPQSVTARFFPNNGVTWARFLSLSPAVLILVFGNGLREELWFRGLFLKKYGRFLSPLAANLLSAVIFTAFHVQVTYTPFLAAFLAFTLGLGLLLGFLMQRSQNLLPSVILHAGSDIPIFLGYLSYASS
jgi:membrane protease YdiL (CAAX protease family)